MSTDDEDIKQRAEESKRWQERMLAECVIEEIQWSEPLLGNSMAKVRLCLNPEPEGFPYHVFAFEEQWGCFWSLDWRPSATELKEMYIGCLNGTARGDGGKHQILWLTVRTVKKLWTELRDELDLE
jgi:hypothetical protein